MSLPDPPSELFTASEILAPPPRSAGFRTREAVYRVAEEVRLRFIDPLLKEVAETITAPLDLSGDPMAALGSPGPFLVVVPIKNPERAAEKVERDYEGDFARLADAVRATIVVDDQAAVADAVAALRASCEAHGWRIVRAKDRFANPTGSGYRDALVNLADPSGLICEVQIAIRPMLVAKERTHKAYEELGALYARFVRENRPPTDDEAGRMELLAEMMREIHDQAWNESNGPIMEASHEALRP